jgi:hypothetical protein
MQMHVVKLTSSALLRGQHTRKLASTGTLVLQLTFTGSTVLINALHIIHNILQAPLISRLVDISARMTRIAQLILETPETSHFPIRSRSCRVSALASGMAAQTKHTCAQDGQLLLAYISTCVLYISTGRENRFAF